jgi:hypothetical protein
LHAFNTAADEKINADKHLWLRSRPDAQGKYQAMLRPMVKLAGA